MVYLNLGCGSKYSTENEWINIDFNPREKAVKKVNILKGLPFKDNTVDLVFSSCMLEHFTKEQAEKHIDECKRVLRPGGMIRIVVPDLENVCKEYLSVLEKVKKDDSFKEKYEYILIELIDQMTRVHPGGEMVKYWDRPMFDEKYVRERTGFPEDWELYHNSEAWNKANKRMEFKNRIVSKLKFLKIFDAGRYSIHGELHKWMYDEYNLKELLLRKGFSSVQVKKYNDSDIPGWEEYAIEINSDGTEYKPNCLYIEAKK